MKPPPPSSLARLVGEAGDNLSLQKKGGIFLKDGHTDTADTPRGSLGGKEFNSLSAMDGRDRPLKN